MIPQNPPITRSTSGFVSPSIYSATPSNEHSKGKLQHNILGFPEALSLFQKSGTMIRPFKKKLQLTKKSRVKTFEALSGKIKFNKKQSLNEAEATITSLNTIKMVEEDDTDEILSQEEPEVVKDNGIYIHESGIDVFDEELRTIVSKRVKDREIQFNNLSLGDEMVETFADQLRKDHNLTKMMLSSNRLSSRGAISMMNKVSNSTNYIDLSSNPDIRLDAYKFLSHQIIDDYRKRINHLDLEGNLLGDQAIEII